VLSDGAAGVGISLLSPQAKEECEKMAVYNVAVSHRVDQLQAEQKELRAAASAAQAEARAAAAAAAKRLQAMDAELAALRPKAVALADEAERATAAAAAARSQVRSNPGSTLPNPRVSPDLTLVVAG